MAAPPQLIHDTLTVIVHDTLAVRDTITRLAGSIPSTLHVKVDDAITSKDVLSWVVQIVVGIGAAFLGAQIGGQRATQAALTSLREEYQIGERRKLGRSDRGITRILERIGDIPERFKASTKGAPLPLPVLRDVAGLWTSYELLLESLSAYPDHDLQWEIERFVQDVRMEAEHATHVEEVLEGFRQKLQPPTRGEEGNYYNAEALSAASSREKTLEFFAGLPKRVKSLLDRHRHAIATCPL